MLILKPYANETRREYRRRMGLVSVGEFLRDAWSDDPDVAKFDAHNRW